MKKLASNNKTALVFTIIFSTMSAHSMEPDSSWPLWFLETSYKINNWLPVEAFAIRAVLHLTGYPALSEKEHSICSKKPKNSKKVIDIVLNGPQEAPFLLLPKEIMIHIIGHCQSKDKNILITVCKDFDEFLNLQENREALLLENPYTISKAEIRNQMFRCVRSGKYNLLHFLLDTNRIDQKNKTVMTLFEIALKKPNINTIKVLIDSGADVNKAFKKEHCYGYEELEALNHEETPLHSALKSGNVDVIQLLINSGADVNQAIERRKGSHNWNKHISYETTPLDFALKIGNLDIIQLLINYGADINQYNQALIHRENPLHAALEHNKPDTAIALINAGADVNQTNNHGYTPLHIASQKGYTEIVKLLLTLGGPNSAVHGPYFIISSIFGGMKMHIIPPICSAVFSGYTEIVELLIAHGADVNYITPKGESLLQVARRLGYTDIEKLL